MNPNPKKDQTVFSQTKLETFVKKNGNFFPSLKNIFI
jgi:hypothetical protein